MRGKLIIIEGVDGSGKQTQTNLLCSRLDTEGFSPLGINFPDYESPASALVKMYLAGEFGKSAFDVPAKVASCFYAMDRYASYKTSWGKQLENGRLIIADRYTTSNMVHQASKLTAPQEKEEFLNWLWDFEFNICALPEPDCVIFLDMPPEITASLIADRANKATGNAGKDIHEHNKQYLAGSYETAKYVAAKYGWHTIVCTQGGNLKSIPQISEEIYQIVRPLL